MQEYPVIAILTAALLLPPVLAVFGLFLYAWIYNMKLFFYLIKNNYGRWETLTTLGRFGPAAGNPFRWIPYVYSDLDTEDPCIRRYKTRIRSGLRLSLYALCLLALSLVVLVLLAVRMSR